MPSGFDTAKFWAIATSDTAAGCVFWIDDVTVREDTESKAALAQANFANAVTDMKARAGTNAVYDPRLSLGPAVTRFRTTWPRTSTTPSSSITPVSGRGSGRRRRRRRAG